MECILDAIGDDSVASVGATVEPSADVVVLREDIHKLSLAFIAPLTTKDYINPGLILLVGRGGVMLVGVPFFRRGW